MVENGDETETETEKNSPEELRLRILVVDDKTANQRILAHLLDKLGYRADFEVSGQEALGALHRRSYEVVLMDTSMPEMDGFEATRRILGERPPGDRPWIIAMTSDASGGERARCLAAGMNDAISRPLRLAEVEAALERSRAREAGHVELDAAALRLLDATLEGDSELLGSIVETLLQSVPRILDQLGEALAERDTKRLVIDAHGLKSNAAMFGATELHGHCVELEAAGRAEDLEEARRSLEQVVRAYGRARPAIEALMS